MKTNGGFLVTKIKQLGDRIFERILAEKNIDAFNGAQGRILYVLWQEDGVPIKIISEKSGLAITSLTTMLERMEKNGLISRKTCSSQIKPKNLKKLMTPYPMRWGIFIIVILRIKRFFSLKSILTASG